MPRRTPARDPHRHPRLDPRPHPEPAGRRRPDRRPPAGAPSWCRSAPRATSPPAPLATDRRHRRLRQRAARGAAARRGRRGRALAQGPAHRSRPTASRWPPCRPARTRATSWWPATASPSASCRPARASAPAPHAGWPSSRPSASASSVVGVRGNVDTRLGKVASGELDAVVLARAGPGPARPRRRGDRGARPAAGAARARAREPSRWSAGPTATCATWCAARSTTRPPARASRRSERCSPSSRRGARPRSAPWPKLRKGTSVTNSWVRAVALSPDGALSVRRSASGPLDDAVGLGQKLAAEMLAEGAAELISAEHRRSKKANVTKQNTSSTPAHRGPERAPAKWVSFVGSGPGDPGLLTVRAVELLREAEIVVTEVPDHEQLVRDAARAARAGRARRRGCDGRARRAGRPGLRRRWLR